MAKHSLSLCLCVIAAACAPRPGATVQAQQADTREVVVLLHGLGRTPLSMLPMAYTLSRAGYRVINWGYSSTCCSVAELGQKLQKDVEAQRGAAERVHFVGHSLGSVIIRWLLAQDQPPTGVGRVVMLAPPNQGSLDADGFTPWLGWLLKPMRELGTDSLSTARRLAAPTGVPIGVIAGEHDGKVTEAETHLAGEADHITVPAAHSFIMVRSDARRLTLAFLRHGRFRPLTPEPLTGP